MADVIKETVNEVDVQKVEPIIIEGPTIFKTSNTAKIVFGVVAGAAAAYGICKGVRCIFKKRKANKEEALKADVYEDAEEADYTEVSDDEE